MRTITMLNRATARRFIPVCSLVKSSVAMSLWCLHVAQQRVGTNVFD
jgi:hypothetical protein